MNLTLIERADPFQLYQASKYSINSNYPIFCLDHCPDAKFVRLDEVSVSFHHDESDKRIAFLDPYFNTELFEKFKEIKSKNNDALYTELCDIKQYLKFFPGIGNVVNLMALRPVILEYLSKKLSLMDKS